MDLPASSYLAVGVKVNLVKDIHINYPLLTSQSLYGFYRAGCR